MRLARATWRWSLRQCLAANCVLQVIAPEDIDKGWHDYNSPTIPAFIAIRTRKSHNRPGL